MLSFKITTRFYIGKIMRCKQELRQDYEGRRGNVELVAVIESSNGGRYAYHKPKSPSEHELGEEVDTDCSPRNPNSEFVLRRHSWAQRRWLSPCQRCNWTSE